MVRSRGMRPALLMAGVTAALCLPLASPADDLRAEEILDCVQKNLPAKTAVQRMEFRSQDRAGGGRTIHSRMHWRRFDDGLSRVLVRVREPADLKGSGVLLIEKTTRADMFVYLPDLQRSRRVTSRMLSGSMFGSDFSYEDFSQLQGMAIDGRSERLPDASLDGVPVYVVTHYPAPDSGSAYDHVTSYIESESCVPLKSEMFEKGGRLRKVMTADRSSIFEENGVRLAKKLRMEDLRDQSKTDLVVTEIEVGGKIPKKTFSITTLERPRVN